MSIYTNIQTLFSLIGKKWTIFVLYIIEQGTTTRTKIIEKLDTADEKIIIERLEELVDFGVLENENNEYILTQMNENDSQHNYSKLLIGGEI